jgi:DinB family protein
MKRIAAEDKPPTLIGYDETAFGRSLFYDQLDAQLACDIFEKNRQMTAEILRRLPQEAFDRVGLHNERGRVTLGSQVKSYTDHLAHHLKFVEQKRAMVSAAR